jgi:hypothetical protein
MAPKGKDTKPKEKKEEGKGDDKEKGKTSKGGTAVKVWFLQAGRSAVCRIYLNCIV